MNKNIFFSFNICCYNSSIYIQETIESIINQTYPNWEIIVIDDGSTDNTEQIIKDYMRKDVPIKYYHQNNKGFANARNRGISMSSYDWIVIIDHDDVCFNDRLEKHLKQIQVDPNCMFFFGDTIHINKDGQEIDTHFRKFNFDKINLEEKHAALSLLNHGCYIDSESVLFNKIAALKVGGFNERYKYLADYDFFIKMGEKYKFSLTFEKLSYWRIHNAQATKKLKKTYNSEIINLFLSKLFNREYKLFFRILLLKKITLLLIRYVRDTLIKNE